MQESDDLLSKSKHKANNTNKKRKKINSGGEIYIFYLSNLTLVIRFPLYTDYIFLLYY